jgi:hypothetical protein
MPCQAGYRASSGRWGASRRTGTSRGSGVLTAGRPAIMEPSETRGQTQEQLQALGKAPRYDVIIQYLALSRRDLQLIRQALESLHKVEQQARPMPGIPNKT